MTRKKQDAELVYELEEEWTGSPSYQASEVFEKGSVYANISI